MKAYRPEFVFFSVLCFFPCPPPWLVRLEPPVLSGFLSSLLPVCCELFGLASPSRFLFHDCHVCFLSPLSALLSTFVRSAMYPSAPRRAFYSPPCRPPACPCVATSLATVLVCLTGGGAPCTHFALLGSLRPHISPTCKNERVPPAASGTVAGALSQTASCHTLLFSLPPS